MGQEELFDTVNISKAARVALLELTNETAGETIIGLMIDHGQIEEEDGDE